MKSEIKTMSFKISAEAFKRGVGIFSQKAELDWSSHIIHIKDFGDCFLIVVQVHGSYPYMESKLQEYADWLEIDPRDRVLSDVMKYLEGLDTPDEAKMRPYYIKRIQELLEKK